jgi:hypothetical protein
MSRGRRGPALGLVLLIVTATASEAARTGPVGARSPTLSTQESAEPSPDEQPQPLSEQEIADLSIQPLQPDFTIIALPTTLRLPVGKLGFRVSHRFSRPLGLGGFSGMLENLFGLDSGALIGLEFRYGLRSGTQIALHRTSDRTIQLFAQQDLLQQDDHTPVSLNALVSVEGTNNFRDEYSPGLGLLISRRVAETAVLYLEPIWVGNTNFVPAPGEPRSTVLLGLGTRVRVRPTVYLVGELAPRLAGYDPGPSHGSFGIEKRAGGHVFQLNFSNSFATTPGPIARGGFGQGDWFIGFNISRKFY